MARKRKQLPPDPVKAQIEDLTHDGRGVCHIEGKAVIVHGALPGEEVLFRYRRKTRNFDEGTTTEVLRSSPDRATPRCPHFHECGGCALQHLSASAQIRAKQTVLLENLKRIGGVEPAEVLEPVTAQTTEGHWGYRRRARLSVRYVHKKGRVLVGFRERQGRYVCDMNECHTLIPSVGFALEDLSQLIDGLDARETIPQVEVAAGDDATILVFRHLESLSASDKDALSRYASSSGFYIYLQPKGPSTIHPLNEAARLSYRLDEYGLEYDFTPVNFVQVNASINQDMIRQAVKKLDLRESDRVLDLFCGLGNFTLPVASKCAHVIGIEGDDDLVDLARANARANGVENVAFEVADLKQDKIAAAGLAQPVQKILLDPPRSGAAEILETVVGLRPERIVYVSCHPGSLARDAGILVNLGYHLAEAGVMDMFPQTAHVESIAVFVAPETGSSDNRSHGR